MTDLYTKIHNLCHAYASLSISATHPFTPALTSAFITNLRTSDAHHSWGHNYLVAQSPSLQGKLDNKAFEEHLNTTLPLMESMHTEIRDILIDERKMKAVVRMSYLLKPIGSEMTIENDLVWILTLKEIEGEVRIWDSIEFIDPEAGRALSAEIRSPLSQNPELRGAAAL